MSLETTLQRSVVRVLKSLERHSYIHSHSTHPTTSLRWSSCRGSRQRLGAPQQLPRPLNLTCLRSFSTSPSLLKKGAKAAREEKASSSTSTPTDDPYDFSTLEADIATALERLKTDLSKLRAGGRFNPEVLEKLRVQPDKKSPQTVQLNDLAQVIPKGRTVQILVGEQDHVRPISAAIQSSPTLSLTPQPDPTGANPLLLILNIPPPTAESRKAVVQEATKAGEKASTSVRDARGKQQKKLREMQKTKSALPDDLKKAGTGMEKVVEKGVGEVKRVVEGARKVLEGG